MKQQISSINDHLLRISKELNLLKIKFEDHFLSDEERHLIEKALIKKNENKLIPASEIFKNV